MKVKRSFWSSPIQQRWEVAFSKSILQLPWFSQSQSQIFPLFLCFHIQSRFSPIGEINKNCLSQAKRSKVSFFKTKLKLNKTCGPHYSMSYCDLLLDLFRPTCYLSLPLCCCLILRNQNAKKQFGPLKREFPNIFNFSRNSNGHSLSKFVFILFLQPWAWLTWTIPSLMESQISSSSFTCCTAFLSKISHKASWLGANTLNANHRHHYHQYHRQ